MKLYIDTTKNHFINIAIRDEEVLVAKKTIEARYSQAEKLLPEIEKLLLDTKYALGDISEIEVLNKSKDEDTSFSALRIGVIAANALGYALGVKVSGKIPEAVSGFDDFDIIRPYYDKKPTIN